MTAAEAKERIKEEFIRRYYEWLDDEQNLSDHDYGWKYGWLKCETLHKDNQKSVLAFQKYIFSAYRSAVAWEKEGYTRQDIWQLAREGFLSEQERKEYGVWRTYYFISQRIAKEIYKEAKAA